MKNFLTTIPISPGWKSKNNFEKYLKQVIKIKGFI